MQTPQTFTREVKKKVSYRYLLALPESYESDPNERWPLMVFLHGAGERGTNLNDVKRHGPPKLVEAGQSFPFILASPQCEPDMIWTTDAVIALVDEVCEKYRVEKSRVYLTGLSMGGYGTWDTIIEYPDRFAAAVPICGGGGIHWLMLRGVKKLPVWVFHGAKDPVVPLEQSQKMVEGLKGIGNPVKFTVYPNAAHDSWTETYNNPELFEWMLKQSRKD